ncbi:MAG: Crp/Fnr family transcriptional regulator [Chitinophagaceae bacterium]
MITKFEEHSCLTCNSKVHSIFSVLNLEDTTALNEVKACSSYKKGQFIFSENGYPQGLYCINHGKIKLATAGLNGKEQILRLLKDGDVAGYRSLISNDRYHCSAIAMEDCSVCFIPRDKFFEMVKTNPKLNLELLKLLSNNLKQAEEQLVSMAQKNVRERMAEALLFFKATYGVNEVDQSLNINFSREEIAGFVGTSTETVIRLLSEFNNDKIVSLTGKKIVIINNEKLVQTANLDH